MHRLVPLLLAAVMGLAMLTLMAAAQTPASDPYGLNKTYTEAFGQSPPPDPSQGPLLYQTIGGIVKWTIGLLGFIFLMIIIHGGIGWMTAGGSEERVEKAKHAINAAIAGLIVTFISYALAEAILLALEVASGTAAPRTITL